MIAATVPAVPTAAPIQNTADTTDKQIGITLTAVTDTGSSPITSYELQRDNGLGGGFYTIRGGDTSPSLSLSYIIKTGIERGVSYRFRYRARNKVGWSSWSPTASLSASTIPTAPSKPTYVSSTDDQIVLAFTQSSDNGGSLITGYEVQVNGEVISDYDFATDGFSYTVDRTTLTLSTVTLTTGNIYIFKYRAVNANGNSLWSQPTSIALAPKPSTPSQPTRATTGNSETSIGVTWTRITADTLPVLEYILYVNDGTSSENTEIYRGSSNSYVLSNTNSGTTYTFYVLAGNYNGQSSLSTGTTLKSCVAPYSVFPPTLVESTSTTLRLSWQSPGSDGGCEVTSFGLLRDDGASGAITTSVDSGTISGNPNLFTHTVSLPTLTGKQVRFKLQVTDRKSVV